MMQQTKKILVVDDDERNIFAMKAVLVSRGLTCVTARSGTQAMELLQNQQDILVALVDMMMPGMDGYQLMGLLRNIPAVRQLRLIAVTAQAMAGDKEKCLAAGADAYISKPVDTDMLFGILQEQLKQTG